MQEPIHDRTLVVAGHICLDLIPRFETRQPGVDLSPGVLVEVGPPLFATGGPVSNTGLALHRLGADVRLIAKIGDDVFGHEVQRLLNRQAQKLTDGLTADPTVATSYSVVISPPGVDRTFLHHPGANQTFAPDDVSEGMLDGACLIHFGYPPVMRRFYADGAGPLVELFQTAHGRGLATSLDMCAIDPAGEAGRVDWRRWLTDALPHTDLFCPSLDELAAMLRQPLDDRFDLRRVVRTADELLGMGAAVVAIKLGSDGLYLRSTSDFKRLTPLAHLVDPAAWCGRELYAPCFVVNVAGTTGAGDSTIAGLLAAVSRGASPADALRAGVAVGACSVEVIEAVTGVPPWSRVADRLASGWPQRAVGDMPEDWRNCDNGTWQRTP